MAQVVVVGVVVVDIHLLLVVAVVVLDKINHYRSKRYINALKL